ncbi:putative oxidoreductase [Drechslerella stenobrocha 248]|uniref:Putative oxidoreductase n=1 Tax=Drechslerella stenobrocha 248 TaxID=1043628 RepID=W7IGT7_9PEZI|nr:putative oxidoreductase [Drechslerella stenobrocha 248]
MSSAVAQRLSRKTVLVTGASSGIGRATALEFARTAADVRLIVTARRVEALEALKAEIEEVTAGKAEVLVQRLDVSDAADVKRFWGGLAAEWRDIDVLVNNAGLVKGFEHVGDIAEEDVNIMYATNVAGLINMTQAAVPIFKARNSGTIINVGSIAGREPYPGGAIYCSTKAAVRAFTESLRKELVNTRIRVSCVDPGQVETEFSVVRFRGDKAKADAVYAGVEPLTGEDIAEVIVFVAGRRENVVVADTLVFPSHQGGASSMHRKS